MNPEFWIYLWSLQLFFRHHPLPASSYVGNKFGWAFSGTRRPSSTSRLLLRRWSILSTPLATPTTHRPPCYSRNCSWALPLSWRRSRTSLMGCSRSGWVGSSAPSTFTSASRPWTRPRARTSISIVCHRRMCRICCWKFWRCHRWPNGTPTPMPVNLH